MTMRVVGVLSTIILVLAFPALGITQGMVQPTMPGPVGYSAPSTGFFPGLGSFGDFDVGGITVTPSARIGYQKLGMNINLPLNNGWALDMQLQDSGLWMWGLGLVVNLNEDVAIFWRGDLSFSKRTTVRTQEEPYYAGEFAVNWTGSNLQWGMSEVGVLLRIRDGAYLIGGLRADRVLTRLSDPRNQFGPVNGSFGFLYQLNIEFHNLTLAEVEATAHQEYWADFQTTIWMPYFGVGLAGVNYRWSLIGAPWAWVDTHIPLRYRQGASLAGDIGVVPYLALGAFGYENFDQELRYTFNKSGGFLETNFEYARNVAPNLRFGIWCKGTWMKFRGTGTGGWSLSGETGLGAYGWFLGNYIPLFDTQTPYSASDSDSARGMVTRFDYGGGLTALLNF